jgi:Phosphotransferase enzyme family
MSGRRERTTSIADSPELLTPAWLTEVLGAPVADVHQQPVGTGQMSDSVRLDLTFDGAVAEGTPSSVIAKLPAADPTSRATGLALRSYEIEVRFYQELASTLPMRTPAVFHADIDVTTGSFVLLLEDMRPARPGDQLVGGTPEQAILAVDELVALHAPRWDDRGLDDIEWLHRDPEVSKLGSLNMIPMLWAGFQDRYADRLGPEVHEAGTALFASFESYLFDDSQPLAVVHGDYRLDNLLFGTDEGGVPIAVVDWQTCAHGTPLADVAYFIGAGLLADRRRELEGDLVRRYHDGLVAAGVSGYSYQACWEGHRRGTWAGLIMAIAAPMLVERTDRGDEMFMTMAHRHAQHALDLDAPALL